MNAFLEFYGLNEQPFGVTPDPRYLYLGSQHREALASLVYGTEAKRGFLVLVAEPGMGKTSLLYQYLESLRGKAHTAFVFQTDCNSRELLRHILADLGLDATGKDLPAMHAMLNEVLTEDMRAGRRFVLVIDEAQNLDEKALESVRLLSNFETPWMKLMQIVIAGQPQLAERLAGAELVQLRQRVSSVIGLQPFASGEVNAYIDHRLWVAGYEGTPLFTVGARLLIAQCSGGIPRNINNLCFNAMSIAFAMGTKKIDSKIVREAIADLDVEPLTPKTKEPAQRLAPSESVAPFGAMFAEKKQQRRPRMVPAIAFTLGLVILAVALGFSSNYGVRAFSLNSLSHNEHGATMAQPVVATSEPTTETSSGTQISAETSATRPVFTVVVPPEFKLEHLSVQYAGKSQDLPLAEVCSLNPAIKDAGRMEVGERLHLPLYLCRKSSEQAPSLVEFLPVRSRENNP
jgi:type II secretory pathway predicted ATPase ExeA